MNENIKQLPAEDVKKMLLTDQLDIDLLDEEMLLYLLDYEISLAENSARKTKFYKMCIGALSKFVDFDVKDEELDAVVSSAYFLCFNKREQRRLLKRLREKNGQGGAKVPRRSHLVEWIICAVALLFLIAFLTGTFILYSERISGARRAWHLACPAAIRIAAELHFPESPDIPLYSARSEKAVPENPVEARYDDTVTWPGNAGSDVSVHNEFIKGIYINTDGKQEWDRHLRDKPIPKMRALHSGFEPYICGERIWYVTDVGSISDSGNDTAAAAARLLFADSVRPDGMA